MTPNLCQLKPSGSSHEQFPAKSPSSPRTTDCWTRIRLNNGPCLMPLSTLLATEGELLGLTAGPMGRL